MALYIIIGIIGLAAILVLDFVWVLHSNPDLHVWPAISRCELCGKRIFAWQKFEYRDYNVQIKSQAYCRIEARGLVHMLCEGIPKVDFIVDVISGFLH